MKLFEDAFLKAGLISEDQLKAKRKQEKEALEQRQNIERKQQREKEESHHKRFALFEELYNNKQKFLLHLIHTFTPTSKLQMWEPNQGKDTRCCACGTYLIGQVEALSKSMDVAQVMLEDLARSAGSNPMTPDERNEQYRKLFGDRKLGVMTPESTASFCKPCLQDFVEWVFVWASDRPTRKT